MEVIKKTQKEYRNVFNEKNKERIEQQQKCELCGGTYTYFNKSKHNKTKLHQFEVLKNELSKLKNV